MIMSQRVIVNAVIDTLRYHPMFFNNVKHHMRKASLSQIPFAFSQVVVLKSVNVVESYRVHFRKVILPLVSDLPSPSPLRLL